MTYFIVGFLAGLALSAAVAVIGLLMLAGEDA